MKAPTNAATLSAPAKLGLLGSLYFSQGLPFGFFMQALPVLLRKQGFSLSQIGLSSLLAMPWALKFLWAPLVDRRSLARVGRRKSWIVPLQLASVVVLGLMVALAVDPPVWAGAAIIGVFALLHGHAHGAEVPDTVNGLEYVAGFALATAMLHAVGIGLGLTLQRAAADPINRLVGVICVAIGAGLCVGVP